MKRLTRENFMRSSLLLTIAFFIATNALAEPSADQLKELDQKAQALTKQFGAELKAVLQATIKSSGPVEAIKVCKINAPEIANHLSQQHNWEVGRTSHRVRNPSNTPDSWEQGVLTTWQEKMAAGTPIGELNASHVFVQNGVATFRYMSAIPTGGVCLNCHGSQLSAPVKQAILENYPKDQAVNFKLGELRGAFTLQKRL